MIYTIIVEDNLFMLRHLESMIEKAEGFKLSGSYRDAFEAEKRCSAEKIDLVLMDVQTAHNHSGLSAGERIRKLGRGTKVLCVTSLVDPEVLKRAKAGAADSLWYKDHGEAELMDVINRTLSGERVFPETSPRVEIKDMFSDEISPRQLAILRRFVEGYTYDEIASELKLSKNGVRWNLGELVEKGGFKNKHELLAAVIENKLIVTTLKE